MFSWDVLITCGIIVLSILLIGRKLIKLKNSTCLTKRGSCSGCPSMNNNCCG